MAKREVMTTILDTRDTIVAVDPATGKLLRWDGNKYVEVSDSLRGKDGKNGKDGYDAGIIRDTRNDNQPPQWYRANYPARSVTELKIPRVIGITNAGDKTVTVVTVIPTATDDTTGVITQRATGASGGQWERCEVNSTTWSVWHEDEVGNLLMRPRDPHTWEAGDSSIKITQSVDMDGYPVTRVERVGAPTYSGHAWSTRPASLGLIGEYALSLTYKTYTTGCSLGFEYWTAVLHKQWITVPNTNGEWQRILIPLRIDPLPVNGCVYVVLRPSDSVGSVIEAKRYRVELYANVDDLRRAQSEMDYLRRAMTEDKTDIRGGVVLGSHIGVRNGQGAMTAYLSGLIGRPALAAGVTPTNGETPEKRIVEIWPDGRCKFGDLRMQPQGAIVFYRDDADKPYMIIGGEMQPLSSMMDKSVESDSTEWDRVGGTSNSITLGESIKVKEGGSVTVKCTISVVANIRSDHFFGKGRVKDRKKYASGSIWLYLYGSRGNGLAVEGTSASVSSDSKPRDDQKPWSDSDIQTKYVNDTLKYLPEDTYTLRAIVICTTDPEDITCSASATVSAGSMVGVWQSDLEAIQYAPAGMCAFYGANRAFYVSKTADTFLTVKGATDVSGVLASGRVDAGGNVRYSWGAYVNERYNSRARVDNTGTGQYRVYHTIGHQNYSVQITPESRYGAYMATVSTYNDYYFDICIFNQYGKLEDNSFHYSAIGQNYF